MTTSIPNEHWVLWFLYINAGILAFLGLMALVKILVVEEEASRPTAKEIIFDDEFRGEV